MTWFSDDSESELYAFEPERFLVPPTEGFLRRLFGARWGMILVSAPDSVRLSPILDFLADFSLQIAYYSEFSAETGDFERLEPEEHRLETIREVLEEARGMLPGHQEEVPVQEQEDEGVVRHVPRNPECVFVQELRPAIVPETIETALSGRLVVSGIRAEGSFPALQMFRGLVGSDHLAAASLMGILGLNTVARICPDCKITVEHQIDQNDLFFIGGGPETVQSCRGAGCPSCGGTGHRGRILIHEAFELSEKIRAGLLEAVPPRRLRIHAKREGMSTLLDAAWSLMDAGETTLEEVIRIADITDPGPDEP
jgi:hypothetical protein